MILNQECDAMVWVYESKGRYSTQSLYAVINFRGGCNQFSYLLFGESECPSKGENIYVASFT